MTGGNVHPDKCWWYLINFIWKEGKWQYVDIGEEDPSLQVRSPSGGKSMLTCLGMSTVVKVLGVWLSPDGKNDRAIEEMHHQSVEWADLV